MSWMPPSACAAPVRDSSRCSPLSSRCQASAMDLAPRSCRGAARCSDKRGAGAAGEAAGPSAPQGGSQPGRQMTRRCLPGSPASPPVPCRARCAARCPCPALQKMEGRWGPVSGVTGMMQQSRPERVEGSRVGSHTDHSCRQPHTRHTASCGCGCGSDGCIS